MYTCTHILLVKHLGIVRLEVCFKAKLHTSYFYFIPLFFLCKKSILKMQFRVKISSNFLKSARVTRQLLELVVTSHWLCNAKITCTLRMNELASQTRHIKRLIKIFRAKILHRSRLFHNQLFLEFLANKNNYTNKNYPNTHMGSKTRVLGFFCQ